MPTSADLGTREQYGKTSMWDDEGSLYNTSIRHYNSVDENTDTFATYHLAIGVCCSVCSYLADI